MSDYNFLKTGFQQVEEKYVLDENYIKMIQTLLQMFQEDSLITAGKYTIGCGRRKVTAMDIKKALMFQAQHFFEQDGSFEERFHEYMNNQYSDDESGEEEESEEEESEEEESEEDENTQEISEEEQNEIDECKKIVNIVDDIFNKWDEWSPEDPIQNIIKKTIDNVPV